MSHASNPFEDTPPAGGGDALMDELEGSDREERSARSRAPNVRGDRGLNEDLQRMGGHMDDLEFERMLEDEFSDERLPAPPAIKGFHVCWLTSNSSFDPLSKRQRLGYIPVRQDEVPHFTPSNGQEIAGLSGIVTCNEMVLHKIAENRYQALMNYFHHKRPMQDEGAQLDKIREGNENAGVDRDGKALGRVEGDGINVMERNYKAASSMRPPRFTS